MNSEIKSLTPNEWAAKRNEILARIKYSDAVQGKGSYFDTPNKTTEKGGVASLLANKTAASLAERISFDYSNMLKLSESGRTTVENGKLKTNCISNFYFDTTGNLTVGYGTNLEAHPDLLETLDIVDKNGRHLTLDEKKDYVRRLKQQYIAMGSPRNMTEAKYANQPVFNEYRVTEASATAAMQREIQNHLNELLADFRAHGVDPATIDHNILKLALDIKYNVGGKLSKKYPTLFGKICRGDYESIEPKDYRACTSKTDKNACNKAREAMKSALVKQAQLLKKVMQENPPPANASAEALAVYKQRVFQAVLKPAISLYTHVPNGQILLPDALRSMALSIETRLHGPLNVNQMASAVQSADKALAAVSNPVSSVALEGLSTTSVNRTA